jgi:glycine betaine catabolism B
VRRGMITKKPYVLEKVEKLSPDIFRFRFRAQDGVAVDFTPGMFAMLAYKDKDTGEEISRAYSISSVPNVDYFDFIITMIHGKLTSKLEAAKPGDVYYVSAPYGQFKIDSDPAKKFLFLAGGSGMVPFLSLLEYVKSNGTRLDASMIYSVRFPYEIICKDELRGLVDHAMLKLTVTVTRPQEGDGWTGQTGRIDAEMVKKYVPDLAGRICYVCGPMAFVNALKAVLQGLGVKDEAIKAEMWGE